MLETLSLHFLVGGVVVSAFSVLGALFTPKSFAGLFGAAPSVAIATLALAVSKKGTSYVSVETRSMLVGAIALGCYSVAVAFLLHRRRVPALRATLYSMPVWFATAFGLWFAFLR